MLTLYMVVAWLVGICYGFVLISSAAGQNDVNLFQVGEKAVYKLHSTVLLNEKTGGGKNVGFFITGDVMVHSLWGESEEKLLKLELKAPQLHIRSRKAPSPDGFIEHSSKLEEFSLKPFYVTWRSGKIGKILLPKGEPKSLANFKKGIASLFQFQILDVETTENDASGSCKTVYHTIDTTKFRKTKTNCISSDLPFVKTAHPILDVLVASSRQVTYELDPKLTHIKAIYAKESHSMVLSVKEDIGSVIEADQILNHVKNEKTGPLQGATLESVVDSVSQGYTEDTLQLQKEENDDDGKTFPNLVNELRDNISNLGNLLSAKSFLRLLDAARKATKDEIVKVLGSKKNQKILPQIYDILGYVQTPEAHASVLKKLHFDKEEHQDLSERYLWSLSLSSHPNPDILKDLLERHRKNDNYPDKVKETLVLTIAQMAFLTQGERKIVRSVEEIIVNNLNYAKGEDRFKFLRALKNLKSVTTVPLLVKIIEEGTFKEGVLAFKAIKALGPSRWTPDIFRIARKTFLQLDRKYDTSARTLAADILLEAQPGDSLLKDFLHYLKTNDSSVEVKQYVMQRLQMLADEDRNFNQRLSHLIRSDPKLNNYEVLAPYGLSTALKRTFLRSPSSNGSLLTIQEIFGGIVKRGIVNVMMDKDSQSREMFSLGIFAGGLSGLVGGEVEGDEETATAGMDLTILDTQIRPFVFFNGQSELMGHVWSGTASERTTAFQALILLQDHLEFIRLGPGFVAQLSLKGGVSFDLSGNIEISLWGRTADSNVEKSAGIVTNGLIAVDASFVRSQIEFSASLEPKLNLKSDIDFSGNMNLCMRVTQPDSIFRHNIYKIERIPGSKHKMRIAKYKKVQVPGTTYSLNRKNNEMCSAMFS
ncbi:microsomal triacylglycerol transfer protein [Tribolium castaneum]|uniref:Microsomal triglyceride transfer protein large subunit-like Protein n=1 Tax=Tribolium castaneum TaxID=7070 RepID=D6WXA1_TRICA|nr:PREDICTED: microsomal triglyceride transfer protein large subunit [Tribolium castaneum]EFA08014.1 Microsomal triglyceride transfer protein large subunit-like Protein [Tribolium castaneum]|eukprot:XP_973610.2 PREDICTED: microsomal triglyceride transfer protein large subunit [Tribolium castaneum]